MYEEWKPIYTALAADVMDSLGRRNQILEHQVRPATAATWFAGLILYGTFTKVSAALRFSVRSTMSEYMLAQTKTGLTGRLPAPSP